MRQISEWKRRRQEIVNNRNLTHARTREYGSYIMEAAVTGNPIRIHGNILNHGLISNLPDEACVEVPCLVDRNGVQGVEVGALPPQCAALNMTNINVQELTIQAALTGDREHVYHAAYLDPHAAGELSIYKIRAMVDELLDAHKDFLPASLRK